MSEQWVGSLVSLDCGQLGDFQGVVVHVNTNQQELTLGDVFRNGLRYEKDRVIISATDIRDLQIVKDPTEAKEVVARQATPGIQVREPEPSTYKSGSPVAVVNSKSISPPHLSQNGRGGRNGYRRLTPTHQQGQNRSTHTPTQEVEGRGSRNTAPNNRSRKTNTPVKSEGAKNRRVKEDAFSDPVSSFKSTEFDFEGNNAMFNKESVYKEIENQNRHSDTMKAVERPTKYRHDENILASQEANLQQIKVPERTSVHFLTDSGLEVPAINTSLMARLLAKAEEYGFNESRRVEMVGRSACDVVLSLLGGASRLAPQNDHQRPSVLVLCGPHLQGAQGVNCARHLANHGVKTYLFLPEFKRYQPTLTEEIKLFNCTEGTRIALNDFSKEKPDLVVLALQSHEKSIWQDQQWYLTAVKNTTALNVQACAIDPPVEGPALTAKLYLAVGLPLPFKLTSSTQPSQIHLCDLGLPPRVFADVGIQYVSPFSHKFVVQLYPK